MSQFMNTLSWHFAIDLYRTKMNAEKRQDMNAIESLKQHYPDIFTEEFNKYIEKAKFISSLLDQVYSENFSQMFDLEGNDNLDEILH